MDTDLVTNNGHRFVEVDPLEKFLRTSMLAAKVLHERISCRIKELLSTCQV